MTYLILLLLSAIVPSFFQCAEGIKNCPRKQVCIRYDKCPYAVKIFNKILSSNSEEEKEQCIQDFKALQCGNLYTEKNVSCDQHQNGMNFLSK